MDVKEARRISDKHNTSSAETQKILQAVYARIKQAAENGCYQITHPFNGINVPNDKMKSAIIAKLRQDGYDFTSHPNPDPGHPCSSGYDRLSW